jgi:hypothetical protein
MTTATVDIRPELVDELILMYCDWRTECAGVRTAYERFSNARAPERGLAFGAYEAALDREESAAHTYAHHVRRLISMCA